MHRTIAPFLVAGLMLPWAWACNEPDAKRAGLQALGEFVGTWNGTGGPDKPKPDPKDPVWKETIDWCWRFKGDDAWLAFTVKDGKYLTGGEVRYIPGRKIYTLKATDAKKQPLEFEGKFEKSYLTFERTDKTTGEVQQLTMNTAADGIRFIYRFATKPKGRTLFNKVYQVAASKEGESLGASAKKNECVVTGGLGTMTVSYMGETFYVCCTGCRDAFLEEPAKYVKAFKEKKNKN